MCLTRGGGWSRWIKGWTGTLGTQKLIRIAMHYTVPYRLREHVKALDEKKPVIICGDMNVAHTEIDLKNPKTNKKNAGFTQEERDGFTELLGTGFEDSFRLFFQLNYQDV